MKTNMDVSTYVPSALKAYGEYPPNSGKFWGIAAEADAQMFVYRKDIMTNATAMADYKAATGKDLEVPQTWTDLLQIAQFFKNSNGNYGVPNLYTTPSHATPTPYDHNPTPY